MTEEERKALEDQLNASADDIFRTEQLKANLDAKVKELEEEVYSGMDPEDAKSLKQAIDMHMVIVGVLVKEGGIHPFKAGYLAVKINQALLDFLKNETSQE